MTDASPGFAGGCVFYREGYTCRAVFRRGDVGIAPYAITRGGAQRGRRPLQRDVEDAVPYEKPSYLSAGYVACVLPAKVGNSLVKEGGIRYNHTRNCTGKGDASIYGIGQQAVHPVHGAGITEGVPEELPHAAVMTGAWKSERMGGTDKLTAQLGGIPVLERTLLALDGASLVDEIVVAVSPERLEELAALCARVGVKKPLRVVEGGASRAQSVLLAALAASEGCELLAVHDGARPLILPVKVADTAGLVQSTPDRRTLFAVQTPQVFQANILKAALQSAIEAGAELTDDCSAVERLGKEVYLAPGWRENIKITTASDLTLAEALLRERENRA